MKYLHFLVMGLVLSVSSATVWAAAVVYDATWNGGLSNVEEMELTDRIEKQVVVPAMKNIASIDADQAAKWSSLGITQNGTLMQIQVHLQIPAEDAAAAKSSAIFEAIRPKLESFLKTEQGRRDEDWLKPQQIEMQDARNRLESTLVRIAEIRAQLRKATDRIDVSPEGLRQAIASLDQEHQRLALEQAGLSVRQTALQSSIAELSKKAEASASDDPAGKQLQAVVKAREAELERLHMMYKQGAVPMSEVAKSESELAEAKFRLLERQSAVTKSAGGDALAELNKDLVNLSISVADNQARIDYIRKALARFAPVADMIDELQSLLARRGHEEELAAKANTALMQLRAVTSGRAQPRVLRMTPIPERAGK